MGDFCCYDAVVSREPVLVQLPQGEQRMLDAGCCGTVLEVLRDLLVVEFLVPGTTDEWAMGVLRSGAVERFWRVPVFPGAQGGAAAARG